MKPYVSKKWSHLKCILALKSVKQWLFLYIFFRYTLWQSSTLFFFAVKCHLHQWFTEISKDLCCINKWRVPLIFLKFTTTHSSSRRHMRWWDGYLTSLPRIYFIRAQFKSTSLQHKDVLLADGRWELRDRMYTEAIEFDWTPEGPKAG